MTVGKTDGTTVGITELGRELGTCEGSRVGIDDGQLVDGKYVGALVGNKEGDGDGSNEGEEVGTLVGADVGTTDTRWNISYFSCIAFAHTIDI